MRTLQELKKKDGFTLIELMIVVVIIGILAMIAIPSMMNYIKRTKTSEAGLNLKAMYEGSVAYYVNEAQREQGLTAAIQSRCTIAGGNTGLTPGRDKQTVAASVYARGTGFYAINTAFPDPVYYNYRVVSAGAGCAGPGPQAARVLYSFDADGDLDGDSTQSLFEVAAGVDGEGNMYRQAGIYVVDELE